MVHITQLLNTHTNTTSLCKSSCGLHAVRVTHRYAASSVGRTEATPMTGPVMKCLRCTNEWKCQCARLPRNASEKQLITKRLSAHIIAIIVTSLIVRSVVRHAAANRPHCQRDEIPPKSQSCLRRCRRCRHRL